MEVHLTSDQEAFIRQAIATGRLHRAEDAVREALALWEERERKRAEFLGSVDEAEESSVQGNGRAITPVAMRELAEDVQRGMSRRAAQKPASR